MTLSRSRYPFAIKDAVRHAGSAAAGLAAIGAVTCTSAMAQVTSVPIFKSSYAVQTGPTTLTSDGYAFDVRLFETSPADVAAVDLTYPGPGSPETVPISTYSTTTFDENSSFVTQGDMDSAFPFGTYTIGWSGGTVGTGSASTDYTEDAYAAEAPIFDASTFAALSSENAGQPITLDWNTFDTGGVADQSFVFFNVFNSLGDDVFSDSFQPASTTSATIPADTLLAGTQYTLTLDFSNRIDGNSGGVGTTIGFDRQTYATLDTAAPEPGSLPLAATAAALLLALPIVRRTRRRLA